jgi:hypothetical protein
MDDKIWSISKHRPPLEMIGMGDGGWGGKRELKKYGCWPILQESGLVELDVRKKY